MTETFQNISFVLGAVFHIIFFLVSCFLGNEMHCQSINAHNIFQSIYKKHTNNWK